MNPIRIAGGGLAGLTCAISLAKEGIPVEVFEKKSAVGGRFWGDLQGLENWTSSDDVIEEIDRFGLGIDIPATPLPPLSLIDGQGLHLDFNQSRPLCYLVKRGTAPDSLDQILYRTALDSGVKVYLNSFLDIKEANVIATGPRNREIFAIDTGLCFQTELPDMAVALVNDKAAFRGYAYLLIVNGYGCICTVMFDRFNEIHRHFKHALDIFKNQFSVVIRDPKRVGGIGSFSNELCFSDQERLFVGEAAGLQDLLWGFGIRTAMKSGVLAARSIIKGEDYHAVASERFSTRLQSGIVLRYLFEKFGKYPRAYAMMGRLVKNQKDPAIFLRKAYGFSSIHKLIYPMAKKGMRKRYPELYF